MADELKRGYLRPRFVEGYDTAIDRMSDRISELEAEIKRLRSALAIAAGMISTMPQYEHQHPESVLDMLLEEARRG